MNTLHLHSFRVHKNAAPLKQAAVGPGSFHQQANAFRVHKNAAPLKL